jgi:citrate lyase subunit beta/citryl-CoA lyase
MKQCGNEAISPRSYLFVPGNRPERFAKALDAGADAIVCDLEDAVQPGEKEVARKYVLDCLAEGASLHVRINGFGTPWFSDDVASLAAHPGVAAIMLPKAETPEHIAAVLRDAHAALEVLPIVETARGFAQLDAMSRAPRVRRIVFGTLDFQLDLGIDGDGDELLMFRSRIVLASRLAGIDAPVDGVVTVLDDERAIEANARRGRCFGFGAMLCIHPKQLAPLHRAYSHSEEEKAWAARVLDAVDASGGALIAEM